MKISGKANKSIFRRQKRQKINRLSLFFLTILLAASLTISSVACGLFYYDKKESPDIKESNARGDVYISNSSQETMPAGKKTQGSSYSDNDANNNQKQATEDFSSYSVKEIIDGDTFSIENGQRVRLIGINTPESGMYFYDEAKTVLEMMIGGKELYLEKDISEMDEYGRLLRYAYYIDLFINLEMVLRGFANAFTYPPDLRYQDRLNEAEKYARINKLGLWAISQVASSGIEVTINPDAAGDDTENLNGEFIIIKNTGSKDINIGGWTVKDSSTSIYEFYGYVLKKGSQIILYTGTGNDGAGNFFWGSKFPLWNNKHDSLYLRDKDGLLVEYISY